MTESQLDLGKQLKSKMDSLLGTLSVLDVLERGNTKGNHKNHVVVTDYNNGSVILPESLKLKVISVVREYYMSELQEVQKQFDEL